MATTYNLPNANVIIQGCSSDASYYYSSGTSTTANMREIFAFTGTEVKQVLYKGNYDVYIDGSLYGNTGDVPAAYTQVTLATGLTDTTHQIQVIQTASSPGSVILRKSNSITVDGASPALVFPTGRGNSYWLRDSSTAALITYEGGTWANGSGIATRVIDHVDHCFRINITATGALTIKLWSIQNGISTIMLVDPYGNILGTVATPSGSPTTILGELTLCTAAAQVSGEYQIWLVKAASGTWQVNDIEIVNGTLGTAPATRNVVCGYGDSITNGDNYTYQNTYQGWLNRIGQRTNLAIHNCGTGGSKVYDGTSLMQGDARCTAVLSIVPQILYIWGGENDRGTGVTIPHFQTAYQTMLQKLLDGVGGYNGLKTTTGTKAIYCLSVRSDLGGTYNTAIQAAIAAVTLPANAPPIIYLDTTATGWPAAALYNDTTHPGVFANDQIASMLMKPRVLTVLASETFHGGVLTGTLALANVLVAGGGTYVAPVAAGYSALATGFGAGGTTTGTLAASKIHDTTYGTLTDANVLVAGGGSYVAPVQAGYSALAAGYGAGGTTTGTLAASKIMDGTYGTLPAANVTADKGGSLSLSDILAGTVTGATLTLPTASHVMADQTYGVGGNGTTGTLALSNVTTTAGGSLDMTTYTLKSSVVSASYVVTGNDNYTGGSAGTYPTTATSQSAQLAADQATVLSAAASIIRPADGGSTILGQSGTFNLASSNAAAASAQYSSDQNEVRSKASSIIRPEDGGLLILEVPGTFNNSADNTTQVNNGKAIQLADDRAEVEAVKGSILNTVTDLLGTVDGTLEGFTASDRAKLNSIGAGPITVVSPIATDLQITIVQGDDYLVADGRQLTWSVSDYHGPSLSGSSVQLLIISRDYYDDGNTTPILTITGTISQVDTTVTIAAELTAEQTGSLPILDNVLLYQVIVTDSDGHKWTAAGPSLLMVTRKV